ncbi:ABC transporter substrate-binding protein [Ferrimonas sediminicola]|uniref:ABC transporter substrate-binding protein n=1 Tax=Ferrimonas sediminicola TaxID=2569538 RepID=A0A4U1BF35_9GAMM|nr:substrate-binding domain-containing protein [Ferrimonas sediminicola]TKB48970.1 ABC transporter substrate-binding protein [Ferrimonas sediminicola]
MILRASILTLIGLAALPAHATQCKASYGEGGITFRLATGSPGELGLLQALAERFNQDHDSRLCWVKAGSGKSLALLKSGDVEMAMVHAPAAEKRAVQEGWATQRSLIGSNEFYLVGPHADPAQVEQAGSIAQAYQRVADNRALFLSRGDNSGTHKKELMIWALTEHQPGGQWYRVTGKFMRATLQQANKQHGYFMTDSSTWVAEKAKLNNLKVLFSGDPILVNTYHALRAVDGNPRALELSRQFIDFVGSDTGQAILTTYGQERYGDAMYTGIGGKAQH